MSGRHRRTDSPSLNASVSREQPPNFQTASPMPGVQREYSVTQKLCANMLTSGERVSAACSSGVQAELKFPDSIRWKPD